jgi:hypothetical protein
MAYGSLRHGARGATSFRDPMLVAEILSGEHLQGCHDGRVDGGDGGDSAGVLSSLATCEVEAGVSFVCEIRTLWKCSTGSLNSKASGKGLGRTLSC